MSIHELYFDEKGNLESSKCLDPEIREAQASGNKFPGIGDSNPIPAHGQSLPEHKIPRLIRTLTAVSEDEVREEEFVMGYGAGDCGYTKIPISSQRYVGEQINQADLKIGNRGFAYSETPVYIAPKKPHRIPVISKLIHHITAA